MIFQCPKIAFMFSSYVKIMRFDKSFTFNVQKRTPPEEESGQVRIFRKNGLKMSFLMSFLMPF
jgi:hypothetical protein